MRDHDTSSGFTIARADVPGALSVLKRCEEALRNGVGEVCADGLQQDAVSAAAAELPRLPVPHMYSA